MEQIIKKAIEGGWKPSHVGGWAKCKNVKEVKESFHFFYPDEESIRQHRHFFYEYFSDPLFWQALTKGCSLPSEYAIPYGLEFHRTNLTEGWDAAVKYLSDLIK